jgi:soluble P-type ATPase
MVDCVWKFYTAAANKTSAQTQMAADAGMPETRVVSTKISGSKNEVLCALANRLSN